MVRKETNVPKSGVSSEVSLMKALGFTVTILNQTSGETVELDQIDDQDDGDLFTITGTK